MFINSRQRGDTLIEVILASAIFALVSVSMFTIMQRLSASAYESLERTQVRMMLNSQADLLRYVRDQYTIVKASGQPVVAGSPASVWVAVRDMVLYNASTPIPTLNSCTDTAPAESFYLKREATGYSLAIGAPTTPTGTPSNGDGVWVQKFDPAGYATLPSKFHDFYVMACWTTVSSQRQTLSTIVRLYEPN